MSPDPRLTADVLLPLIRRYHGNISRIATAAKASRLGVSLAIAREELELELHQCREARVDKAEEILDQALRKKERWAVLEVLHSQHGRRRGYTLSDAATQPPAGGGELERIQQILVAIGTQSPELGEAIADALAALDDVDRGR